MTQLVLTVHARWPKYLGVVLDASPMTPAQELAHLHSGGARSLRGVQALARELAERHVAAVTIAEPAYRAHRELSAPVRRVYRERAYFKVRAVIRPLLESVA